MKKAVLSTLLCLSIFACKKEETPVTPIAPAETKHFKATINGSAFSANAYELSGGGVYHTSYDIKGGTGNQMEPYIELTGKFQTGIHILGVWPSEYQGIYKQNNKYYNAISGSINILAFDTSGTTLFKHFTATFNFNTDTIAGTSYQITSGDIDYFN